MLLHQACEELTQAVVVWVREEFHGVDVVHRGCEDFWQSAEKLLPAVAFQREEFLIGPDHVVGINLHPGQFSLDQEDRRVEQAFQVVSAAEGEFGVGGATAEPKRAIELVLKFLKNVLPVLDV